MKNLFSIKVRSLLFGMAFFHIIFSTSTLQCQELLLHTKNLDAYVGTWEYKTNTETFRVVLKRGVLYSPDQTLMFENVFGGHLYIKDGATMADHTPYVADATADHQKMTVYASNGDLEHESVDPHVLQMGFFDRHKQKDRTGKLVLLLNNPPQLHWTVHKTAEMTALNSEEDHPWSAPEEAILTKISD